MVKAPDITVFDRRLLARRRTRASRMEGDYNFLLEWSALELRSRLADIRRDFKTVLQIGARGPAIYNHSIVTDISLDTLKKHTDTVIHSDEEFLPFKNESLDLIVSNLSLHSTNDLPGALMQIKQALKADGLFIACILGGETLHELRSSLTHAELTVKNGASPRVFPFADRQEAGALMQRAGFALPVVDCETITVTYSDMFRLLHDVRGMGEGNIILQRDKSYPGKKYFLEAADYYAKNFADPDGRIRATFEIIFMIGWSPHESQQKPLRPGSATIRLADALDAIETGTGEKATP